jgi:hypothetical protein
MAARGVMVKVAARTQEQLRRFAPGAVPVVEVNEFPKSGGTWIAKMIADAIDLPFVDQAPLPTTFPAVIRVHSAPRATKLRTVEVLRDGRDVMVSLFHHRAGRFQTNAPKGSALRRAFPDGLDVNRIGEQLPRFLEVELHHVTKGATAPWHRHVMSWLDLEPAPHRVTTTYEAFLADPHAELARVAGALGHEPGDLRVDLAVRKNDRSVMPSHAMGASFFRSGQAGGWQNVFDAESRRVFADAAQPALERCGYENDRRWVDAT